MDGAGAAGLAERGRLLGEPLGEEAIEAEEEDATATLDGAAGRLDREHGLAGAGEAVDHESRVVSELVEDAELLRVKRRTSSSCASMRARGLT